jgi:hypothetical protein
MTDYTAVAQMREMQAKISRQEQAITVQRGTIMRLRRRIVDDDDDDDGPSSAAAGQKRKEDKMRTKEEAATWYLHHRAPCSLLPAS